MRKVIEEQMNFGEVDISEIQFDPRERDEIPKLLMGLQYIYCTPQIRKEVFIILKGIVPQRVNPDNGRRGMDLWKILVMGTIRLNCNWDYDKLLNIVNEHRTIRLMLGHGMGDEDYRYPLQTLKDNVSLLTEEVLDEINQVVVKEGHEVKKKEDGLKGRCDSTVVKTDVHYPTDINLLLDAIRKIVTLTSRLCIKHGIPGWRQYKKNILTCKKYYRKAQTIKKSNAKNTEKQKKQKKEIIKAHKKYIDIVKFFLARTEESLKQIPDSDFISGIRILEIMKYMLDAYRQIDQITKRVLNGEKIPHREKVFSIFEEHTEWISKGKAGVPQELGLNVCIVEDQYGFILHHKVMEKQSDKDIAVIMMADTKKRFEDLASCSFDKGFYSPENLNKLKKILTKVILPKKGKLSLEEKEREYDEEFVQGKKNHSVIESAISAMKNHGLDRCLDHGIDGFKRYVALAVVARNIQILGHHLQQKEFKKLKKRNNNKDSGKARAA